MAIMAVVATLGLELGWWRTRLFTSPSYWASMAIAFAFMVPVNGWLTKLSAPVVRYDADEISGWRVPFDIPIEDFAFGFVLLTLVLLCWVRVGERTLS